MNTGDKSKNKIAYFIIIFVVVVYLINTCNDMSNDTESNNANYITHDSIIQVDNSGSQINSSDVALNNPSYEITCNKAVAEVDSIGTVWTYGLVEVTNTGNCDLFLNTGKFDIEDPSGKLLASQSLISVYPQIISPGEKAYYYDAMLLDGIKAGAEIVIVPTVDIEIATTSKREFPVLDVDFSDVGRDAAKVLGRVENTSEEPISYVYVVVCLYDKDNNPLGVEFTIISDEIASGSKSGFEFSIDSLPDSIVFDDIGSYRIIAYERQFQF